MKKFLAMVIAVIFVLGLIAGCGEAVGDGESLVMTEEELKGAKIAICMDTINHPVHRIIQVSFFKSAEEYGYKGVLSGLDGGSVQEHLAKWESAITNGAIGCLIWTGDTSAYEFMRQMSDVCKFVVPHFAHEYTDTKEFISRNVSSLAAKYGEKAGEFILDRLAKKGVTSGVIAITQAGPNVTENAAADAFRSAIMSSGTNFKLADVVYEGLEITEATNKCTAIINRNTDIVGAFGTTGGSCQAWDAAMAGTGKRDLVVVGVDYVEKNIELVERESIKGLVAQPLWEEAQICVKSLDEIFRGKDFTGSEDEWFYEIEAPIAYNGGEGLEDVSFYKDYIQTVKDYFQD